VIGTNNVVWVADGSSAPAASETTSGIAELATQAETDAGADDLRMVTPLKLANWPGRKRKTIAATFGDGTATQFDFTHNFGTRDAQAVIYRNSAPFDNIGVDISRPDVNTLRANFVGAPTANQFVVYVTA
jgi:hypothetical protein